jgi:hypothetical protein
VLSKHKFDFITVGLEELSIFPKHVLGKICDHIGIKYEEEMLHPQGSKSHIVRGNIARSDKEKLEQFVYDCRWFTSLRMLILGPLLLPLYCWNLKNVYSNICAYDDDMRRRDCLIFGEGPKANLKKRDKLYRP